MRINILMWVLITPFWLMAQTEREEDFYLWFDLSSKETCRVEVEAKGYQIINKFRRFNKRTNMDIFYICESIFGFNRQSSDIDTLSIKSLRKLKIVDYEYLIKKKYETKAIFTPYKYVYLIEKISPGEVVVYKVRWLDGLIKEDN